MHGPETISNLALKIWHILPTKLKSIVSATLIKKKIRENSLKVFHDVYLKRVYKILDLCKLSAHTSLFCNIWYVIHIRDL